MAEKKTIDGKVMNPKRFTDWVPGKTLKVTKAPKGGATK